MTEQKQPEIVVSFEGVKMKEFRAYWAAVAKGDWVGQDTFFARIVKHWPWDLDPEKIESYAELELEQYFKVQKAISNASGALADYQNVATQSKYKESVLSQL
jgi:hypothetical protein